MICPTCNGTGQEKVRSYESAPRYITCQRCRGTGQIASKVNWWNRFIEWVTRANDPRAKR